MDWNTLTVIVSVFSDKSSIFFLQNWGLVLYKMYNGMCDACMLFIVIKMAAELFNL